MEGAAAGESVIAMSEQAARRSFSAKLRAVASWVLAPSFVALSLSGVLMYFHVGSFLGLDRHGWSGLHNATALVVVIAGLVHLVLNWRPLVCYLAPSGRQRRRLGIGAAVSLVAVVLLVAGAILRVPPATWLMGGEGGGPGQGMEHRFGPGGPGGPPEGWDRD